MSVLFGSSIAGPISKTPTFDDVTESKTLVSAFTFGSVPVARQISSAGKYRSAVFGELFRVVPPLVVGTFTFTASTVPSDSRVQPSSLHQPTLVSATVPNPVPDCTQPSVTGSQIAVEVAFNAPKITRPSGSTQAEASPWMKLNAVGLVRVLQLFATGSKISASGVLPPALENSPPTTNRRPSLKMPDAKNRLVSAMADSSPQDPPKYPFPGAGGSRSPSDPPLLLL